MRIIRAISYGKPINWGRCFTIVRKAGLVAVGERARVILADEAGLVWAGVAECFGVTPQSDGRAVRVVYDFEKVGDAEWLKQGNYNA